MNDSLRHLLRTILQKEALRHFPTYFEEIYQKRCENDSWNEKSPFFDVFIPCSMQSAKGVEGTLMNVLPAPRCFWDCWFAVYQLEKPEIFSSPAIVAKVILREIQELKLQPAGFVNFEHHNLVHLQQLAAGQRENLFLKNPKDTVLGLMLAPMIECSRGALEPEQFMQTEKCQEQVAVAMEKLDADWAEKYPELNKEKNF